MLTHFQSGFRKHRSTTDQLLRLESFIREAFVRREHVVSVFFDLEKAYDTTWKYDILRDLQAAGLRGRLPLFISDFLSNRSFRVRLGSLLSDTCEQEMGVPQGSILSVTLFILKINNIVKCLSPGIRCSLYVDDFLICYRSTSMRLVERQLQRCLNHIQTWADENGFRFSETKTVCMHFCRQHRLHPDPELMLNGTSIPLVEETKFLGLIFDNKLTFLPHIKYLRDKCLRAMNLLRVVSHTNWGADTTTLLKLYRSLVRSKLDYGCVVYGSACNTHLQLLDCIQNSALRICLGAFRTSPASSLHVEANELPLELRWVKLSLQYILKLKANSAYNCVFNNNFKPFLIPNLTIYQPWASECKSTYKKQQLTWIKLLPSLSLLTHLGFSSPLPLYSICTDWAANQKLLLTNLKQNLLNFWLHSMDTFVYTLTVLKTVPPSQLQQ